MGHGARHLKVRYRLFSGRHGDQGKWRQGEILNGIEHMDRSMGLYRPTSLSSHVPFSSGQGAWN
jgi:hypothetical protein